MNWVDKTLEGLEIEIYHIINEIWSCHFRGEDRLMEVLEQFSMRRFSLRDFKEETSQTL